MICIRNFVLLWSLILSINCSSYDQAQQPIEKPNILFIAVDDLRPELGCYGVEHVHSPNIDQLAAEATLFTNHYVHVPTCGASRFALLTGRLPRTRNHLRNMIIADSLAGKPETDQPESFVHHLRRNGYRTVGIGKISHMPDGYVYGYQEEVSSIKEMPHSWDEFLFDHSKWTSGHDAFFGYADGSNRNDLNKQVKPYEMADVSDEGYPDGLTANLALDQLNKLQKQSKPFFLAVGLFKPHLPFNAPKKYWDLYDPKDIPLSPFPNLPKDQNPTSVHNSGEFNQYALGEERASSKHNLSDAYAIKLRHAYLACVSYIDAQIGKIIGKLKDQGLYDNTIIVLWGDHGWHLGDHRVWGKHTLSEWSLKSPLIIKPTNTSASIVESPVGTIDIYPTLMELCDVSKPRLIDGRSLVPLFKSPNLEWEYPVYGYYRNGITMRKGPHRVTKYLEGQPSVEIQDVTKNLNISSPSKIVESDSLLRFLENGNLGLFKF